MEKNTKRKRLNSDVEKFVPQTITNQTNNLQFNEL